MFLRLKQATELLGKDYKLGVHKFPDEVLEDRNFKFLSEHGLIEEVDAAPKPVLSAQDENAELAKRLAAEGGFKLAEKSGIDTSEAPAVDSAPSTPVGASDADEGKSKKKGK